MKPFFPPLIIYLVPSDKWDHTLDGLSFDIVQQKFDDSFRRLIKGTGRKRERDHLYTWFDQLRTFTPAIIHENGIIPVSPDQEMIAQWSRLLPALAKAQAKTILQAGGPDGIPPFLSCIWAPPRSENSQVSLYQSTVNRHLAFLNQLIQSNRIHPSLSSALNYRKKIFSAANGKNMGVVEYTGKLC